VSSKSAIDDKGDVVVVRWCRDIVCACGWPGCGWVGKRNMGGPGGVHLWELKGFGSVIFFNKENYIVS